MYSKKKKGSKTVILHWEKKNGATLEGGTKMAQP